MSRETGLWMPMYWADYLADTTHLTTEQHGAYFLLIGTYWRQGRPLPNDDKKLAQITRLSHADWIKVREEILCFFVAKNGRLHHKRIDQELKKAKNITLSRSNAGKIGAANRWQTHNKSHAIASTNRCTTQHNTAPLPIPIPSKKDADERNPVFCVLDAMGVRNDPNWHGDGGRVRAWLNDGADLELDILPTIKRVMAKRNGQGPPTSLKYFDQAIADAKATRLTPLPAGTPKGNGNGHSTGPVTKLFEGAARAIAKREEADRTTNHDAPKSLLDRR